MCIHALSSTLPSTKWTLKFFFLYLFRLNFSDTEIEIFCAKYDKDGNFEFTLEEINAIEEGLEEEEELLEKLEEEEQEKAVFGSRPNSSASEKPELPMPTQFKLER